MLEQDFKTKQDELEKKLSMRRKLIREKLIQESCIATAESFICGQHLVAKARLRYNDITANLVVIDIEIKKLKKEIRDVL